MPVGVRRTSGSTIMVAAYVNPLRWEKAFPTDFNALYDRTGHIGRGWGKAAMSLEITLASWLPPRDVCGSHCIMHWFGLAPHCDPLTTCVVLGWGFRQTLRCRPSKV